MKFLKMFFVYFSLVFVLASCSDNFDEEAYEEAKQQVPNKVHKKVNVPKTTVVPKKVVQYKPELIEQQEAEIEAKSDEDATREEFSAEFQKRIVEIVEDEKERLRGIVTDQKHEEWDLERWAEEVATRIVEEDAARWDEEDAARWDEEDAEEARWDEVRRARWDEEVATAARWDEEVATAARWAKKEDETEYWNSYGNSLGW